jgi:hypothetical protein
MRRARLLLGIAGTGLMAYAIVGTLTDPLAHPVEQFGALLVLVLLHDGLVVPVALVAGWLTVRCLPAWARGPVQGGLLAAAALTVVAIPFLVNADRHPDNPSLLPLDYRQGLAIAIGACWLVAAAVTWARWRRRRGELNSRTQGRRGHG